MKARIFFQPLFEILIEYLGLEISLSKVISEDSCNGSPCKNEADCVPLPNGDHFCKCLGN